MGAVMAISTAISTVQRFGPVSGGKPKQLVVLCHGVGASGEDLIPLAPVFARALPDALFLAPDAPEPYDHAPFGRQWFSLGDLNPAKLGPGVRRGAQALDAWLAAELARLELADYALFGFSQGAMTVLFAGLRRLPAPKAILAFSGALIEPGALAAELRNRAAVLLAHGEADAVVPAGLSRAAALVLREAGVPVETVFTPGLDHSIGEAGIAAGIALLERGFAVTP
jgi:phospholipase/carboxylesterase